jgi:hypothetical protein
MSDPMTQSSDAAVHAIKQPISQDLLEGILRMLTTAPVSEIQPDIVFEIETFLKQKPNAPQMFEYLVEFSRKPPNEISPFVRTLCSVDTFYLRPTQDLV